MYGFKITPNQKGKKLGIDTTVHAPYLGNVHWTKKRAEKEAKFFINNFMVMKNSHGIPVKGLVKAKVFKLKKVM